MYVPVTIHPYIHHLSLHRQRWAHLPLRGVHGCTLSTRCCLLYAYTRTNGCTVVRIGERDTTHPWDEFFQLEHSAAEIRNSVGAKSGDRALEL